MQAPETSTTLLRDLSSDANHVRWTEASRRYHAEFLETDGGAVVGYLLRLALLKTVDVKAGGSAVNCDF